MFFILLVLFILVTRPRINSQVEISIFSFTISLSQEYFFNLIIYSNHMSSLLSCIAIYCIFHSINHFVSQNRNIFYTARLYRIAIECGIYILDRGNRLLTENLFQTPDIFGMMQWLHKKNDILLQLPMGTFYITIQW